MREYRGAWPMMVAAAAVALAATMLVPALATQDEATAPPAGGAVSADLRARVERLQGETASPSEDTQVLLGRLDTLWEWMNALSLEGVVIPVDLPYYIAGVRNALRGQPEQPVRPAQVNRLLARYVRELQIKEGTPGAIGSLTISDAGPFVVGQVVTISETYTVGDMPMASGGGVMITQLRTRQLQTDNPKGEGYLTLRCSNPDARFELVEPWDDWRTFITNPVACFRLSGGTLRKGDTITVTFGDRSGGGPGLVLESSSKDSLFLPVYVDLEGKGDMLSPAWPSYALLGEPRAQMVNGVAPSIVAPGEPFSLAVRWEDRFKNPISGEAPAFRVLLDGEQVASKPGGDGAVVEVRDLKLPEPGVYRFQIRSDDGAVSGASNPVLVRPSPPYRIFWGDPHGHSQMADAQGSPDGYYRFARDVARLDFVTLSEHDIWMDDSEWRLLQELTESYLDPGAFTTFLGYEWTVSNPSGGHHNVYFRDAKGRRRVPHQTSKNQEELYAGLRSLHRPEDVLIIPHAHMAGDWSKTDADMERLTEISSGHGSFEWFSNRYLQNGFVVGFVGGSDNHSQHPGYSAGTNRQLGGLAAVLAPQNTSKELFDALRGRRCYATTGERIILDADLNGRGMGQIVPEASQRKVRCRVFGTAPIDTVDLIRNGGVVYSKRYLEARLVPHTWVQVKLESSSEVFGGHYNPRGQRNWRGTIAVKGARLASFKRPWFFNPESYLVERDAADPDLLRFSTNTRGRGKGLLLELEGASEATVVTVHLDPGRESPSPGGYGERPPQPLPAADFGFVLGHLVDGPAIRTLQVERNTDSVTVQLVPGDAALDQEFEYADLAQTRPGDYYYVRVTQVDGAMAWSSPWFVEDSRR